MSVPLRCRTKTSTNPLWRGLRLYFLYRRQYGLSMVRGRFETNWRLSRCRCRCTRLRFRGRDFRGSWSRALSRSGCNWGRLGKPRQVVVQFVFRTCSNSSARSQCSQQASVILMDVSFLISSRPAFRPCFSLNAFSHAFSSARSEIVST